MLRRISLGVVFAAGAAVIGTPAAAWADPDSAPVLPNINGYALAMPAEYVVAGSNIYAFTTPDGLTCILDKGTGGYGCSGPIPAAPNGANLVSGGSAGSPGFANADRPVFSSSEPIKALPPNTRLSFRTISCGYDGAGTTICTNSFDQTGFVLSPAGSFVVGA